MGDGDAPQPLNVEQFRARVRVILRKADLNTITAKAVRVQIQEENDVDLSVHDVKKKFDALVMEVLNEVTGADDDDDDDNGSTAQKGNKDVAVKKEETSTPARQEARVHDSSSKTSRPVPMSSAPSSIGGPGRKKEIKSEEFVHDSDSDGEGPRRSTNYNARNLTDEELARQLQEEESALRSRPGKRKAAPVSSSGSKRAKVEGGKKRGGGGFQRPWVLSEALSAVCGGAKELSRGQAVKQLWTYIKENGLQDPNHKKTIICDDQLKTLFGGKKKVDSFGMMKLLSSHMWKSEDDGGKVVESSEDEDDESLAESEESNPPKKSKASSSKAAASSSATKAKKAKGAAAGGGGGGGGWNAALLLSPALREVVEEATGEKHVNSMPRPGVVKQLWVYIRAHELQNPNDRRVILADDKLRPVFGKPSVTMFSMNKSLKNHLRPIPAGANPKTARWEDFFDDPTPKQAKDDDGGSESDSDEDDDDGMEDGSQADDGTEQDGDEQ